MNFEQWALDVAQKVAAGADTSVDFAKRYMNRAEFFVRERYDAGDSAREVSEAFLAALGYLRLDKGDVVKIGRAILRHHSHNTYTLTLDARKRWGTKVQIEEDIEHFLRSGTLPQSKNAWH